MSPTKMNRRTSNETAYSSRSAQDSWPSLPDCWEVETVSDLYSQSHIIGDFEPLPIKSGKTHRTAWIVALALLAAGAAYAAYLFYPPARAVSDGSTLVVWSSQDPQGKTWQALGDKGGVIAVPADRRDPEVGGLTVRMTAPDYRCFGLNWKAWFPSDAADDCSRFSHLRFKVRLLLNSAPHPDLSVRLVDNAGGIDIENGATIPVVAGGYLSKLDKNWQEVRIPLAAFAQYRKLRLDRLWEIVFSNTDLGEQLFQIDDIAFVQEQAKSESNPYATSLSDPPANPMASTGPTTQGDKPKTAPNPMEISKTTSPAASHGYPARAHMGTESAGWPIRDAIYGVANMPKERREVYGLPLSRFGGNTTSRYNWRINADSGADDWYYKNRGPAASPRDHAYWQHYADNNSFGASSYLTVPMLGWVAKDNSSYSFSVGKYGPQKAHEPNFPDIGNGVKEDGTFVSRNDPRDASVQFAPSDVAEAVQITVERANSLSAQGLKQTERYWALDNEPMLWHKTHRDVHPEPVGYDELWTKTVLYAEAIRKADPQAKIAGFCSWGWNDLFYSARDQGLDHYYNSPDRRAHGDVPLAEWFLKKCAEYKAKHGQPLIDVLDVHWYPQAEIGGKTPYTGKGAALNELRLRTTRDLWDPNYFQESWVRDAGDRKPVALIPRMKKLIETHCPGLELSLGEYNFGGGENLTGGLAQAELFGIFARERLDLAFFWQQPEGTQWAAWELFRNYDGKKARFGTRFIPIECDNSRCAVFAARRESDNALTVVLINKSLGVDCRLKLDLPGITGEARLWRFDAESQARMTALPQTVSVQNGAELILPPASATMFVVK